MAFFAVVINSLNIENYIELLTGYVTVNKYNQMKQSTNRRTIKIRYLGAFD